MAKLKRYTSFDALKSNDTSGKLVHDLNNNSSEFEDFVKQLQVSYSNKKKVMINDDKHAKIFGFKKVFKKEF